MTAQKARKRLQFMQSCYNSESKEIANRNMNPIYEDKESNSSQEVIDDQPGCAEVAENPLFAEGHHVKFEGLLMVADDQHINLEILKQHMRAIGIED